MDLQATLAVSFVGRGQALIMEGGPARFGSYRPGRALSSRAEAAGRVRTPSQPATWFS